MQYSNWQISTDIYWAKTIYFHKTFPFKSFTDGRSFPNTYRLWKSAFIRNFLFTWVSGLNVQGTKTISANQKMYYLQHDV